MGGTITRIRNGETVSVRTGVLRGAGPQGPMGLQGPIGASGGVGPAGPVGSLNDVFSKRTSSAAVALSSAGYTDMAIETGTDIALITVVDNFSFQVKATGLYAVAIQADYVKPAGDGNGLRAFRFVDLGLTEVITAQHQAISNDTTRVWATSIVTLDASKTYKLQGKTFDTSGGINCTARSITLTRFGSGPTGPQGVQGPVGQTGPQGVQGVPGNAASGFSSFNLIEGAAADTTVVPTTGNTLTPDQGVAYPLGTAQPKAPYYFRTLAEFFEKRIIARFDSAADRNTRRAARTQGEVYHLIDTGEFFVKEKVGGTETNLGRVIYSASAPPGGAGQASPGIIWIQT